MRVAVQEMLWITLVFIAVVLIIDAMVWLHAAWQCGVSWRWCY